MAASGSILGNAVLRLEDPDAADGRGQVRRRPRRAEHGARRVRALHRSRTPTCARSTSARRRRCRAWSAVYHAGGDDLGLAPLQRLPDDARDAEPARVRRATRCASSATSSPRSSPRPAAQAVDAAEAVVVDYDPLPAVVTAARRAGARRAAALPRARLERLLRHDRSPRTTTPTRSTAPTCVAEVTMVSQRLAGVPMETNGILAVPEPTAASRCWVSHQAPHAAARRVRADARPRAGAAPRRVPVGRRRLRPEGGDRTSSTSSPRRPR